MKPKKTAWRTHYTRDWAIDPFVRGLDLEARMVYLELLDIAWDEHGLKQEWLDTGEYVAARIGISKRLFRSCWERVRTKFVEISPGVRSQVRLESERSRARKFAEKQANNAKGKENDSDLAEPAGAITSQSHTQTQKEERGLSAPPPPLLLEAQGHLEPPPDAIVTELFGVLNTARIEVVEGARALKPLEVNLAGIKARLAEGASPDDIRHVISVVAAEVKTKPEAAQWFDAESPFRPANFQRLLARTVKSASMPRQQRSGGAPERFDNHPPTAAERRRDYEESEAKRRAENERDLTAQGYRFEGERWFDPQGRELDNRGRPMAKASS